MVTHLTARQDMEGHGEVVQRFLELLPPEARLKGLEPEDVMRSFAPEEPTRTAVRERLGR